MIKPRRRGASPPLVNDSHDLALSDDESSSDSGPEEVVVSDSDVADQPFEQEDEVQLPEAFPAHEAVGSAEVAVQAGSPAPEATGALAQAAAPAQSAAEQGDAEVAERLQRALDAGPRQSARRATRAHPNGSPVRAAAAAAGGRASGRSPRPSPPPAEQQAPSPSASGCDPQRRGYMPLLEALRAQGHNSLVTCWGPGCIGARRGTPLAP
jgi:hypothetical protein